MPCEKDHHPCFEEIDSSDGFIGIYAHRYGFTPESSSVSITEREFGFASQRKKPIFCFIVDETYPWLPRFIDQEPKGYFRFADAQIFEYFTSVS